VWTSPQEAPLLLLLLPLGVSGLSHLYLQRRQWSKIFDLFALDFVFVSS